MEYCHSCTMPLSAETRRPGSDAPYCRHCTDDSGGLLERERVQRGIAGWMRSWQGDIPEDLALARAGRFMSALPAWADD